MPVRHLQREGACQSRAGGVDLQHPRRLLLEHQNQAVGRRLHRLELDAPVGKVQVGQVGALPPQRPLIQRRGEQCRIVVPHRQQAPTEPRQSGHLAQGDVADVAHGELRRLTHGRPAPG